MLTLIDPEIRRVEDDVWIVCDGEGNTIDSFHSIEEAENLRTQIVMNRTQPLTAADISESMTHSDRAAALEILKTHPAIPPAVRQSILLSGEQSLERQAWYADVWLTMTLTQSGCPQETRTTIMQMLSITTRIVGPWEAAAHAWNHFVGLVMKEATH